MTDIAQLFATDPLKHTEQDIVEIIKKFREARHVFNSGAAAPQKKAAPASKLSLDIDLGDL